MLGVFARTDSKLGRGRGRGGHRKRAQMSIGERTEDGLCPPGTFTPGICGCPSLVALARWRSRLDGVLEDKGYCAYDWGCAYRKQRSNSNWALGEIHVNHKPC